MNLPRDIAAFVKKYEIDEVNELWCVHGKTWVVKHKALERVANRLGITFDRPSVIACDIEGKSMIVCTFGKLGDKTDWSFGEASPANNKNAYFAAMAEKRSRDRVILKLLDTHGALYSEAEADEFRENPHVTRPKDIVPPADYDQNGEIIDNVPHAEPAKKLRVVDQRPIFEALQKEAHAFKNANAFLVWMNSETTIDRVKNIKADWQEIFRGLCKEHLASLRENSNIMMAG